MACAGSVLVRLLRGLYGLYQFGRQCLPNCAKYSFSHFAELINAPLWHQTGDTLEGGACAAVGVWPRIWRAIRLVCTRHRWSVYQREGPRGSVRLGLRQKTNPKSTSSGATNPTRVKGLLSISASRAALLQQPGLASCGNHGLRTYAAAIHHPIAIRRRRLIQGVRCGTDCTRQVYR